MKSQMRTCCVDRFDAERTPRRMTEDTSPENLRKFLESDDPAMRMMGLSMAKNIDLSENLKGHLNLTLAERLWVIMKSDPIEENRTTAMELLENNEEEIHEKELMIRLINDEKTSEETKTKIMNSALHHFDTDDLLLELWNEDPEVRNKAEELFWDTIANEGHDKALISIVSSDPESYAYHLDAFNSYQYIDRAVQLIGELDLLDDDVIKALISATESEGVQRSSAFHELTSICVRDPDLKLKKYIAGYIIKRNWNDCLYEIYATLEENDQIPYLIEIFFEQKRELINEYGNKTSNDSYAAEIISNFLKSKDTNISSELISKAKEVLEILK